MTDKQKKLYQIGEQVKDALPVLSSIMKPSANALRVAAHRLNISTALAQRALSFYLYN